MKLLVFLSLHGCLSYFSMHFFFNIENFIVGRSQIYKKVAKGVQPSPLPVTQSKLRHQLGYKAKCIILILTSFSSNAFFFLFQKLTQYTTLCFIPMHFKIQNFIISILNVFL